MGWWVAERGTSPSDVADTLEVNESAAKVRAVELSKHAPGTAFQVRYHANANAPTEMRWEALDGVLVQLTRDARMSGSERRIGLRHFVCFPAQVEAPTHGKRVAMIHDLSVTGAMLVVRATLEVGDLVSLALHVSGDASSRSREAHAHVVRVEPLAPEERSLWSHRIAVQFEQPLTDFETEIRELAAWQHQLRTR